MKAQRKQDPLVRAMKSAYRKSWRYRLDQLLKERVRWQRKHTISCNKLCRVDAQIRALTFELTEIADKRGEP